MRKGLNTDNLYISERDIGMADIHPTVLGQQQQSEIAIKIRTPMSWC